MFSTLGQADDSEIPPVLKANWPQSKNSGMHCALLRPRDIQFLYQSHVVQVETDSEAEFQNLLTLVPSWNNLVLNQAKVISSFSWDESPIMIIMSIEITTENSTLISRWITPRSINHRSVETNSSKFILNRRRVVRTEPEKQASLKSVCISTMWCSFYTSVSSFS